jgi:hypothetical protein
MLDAGYWAWDLFRASSIQHPASSLSFQGVAHSMNDSSENALICHNILHHLLRANPYDTRLDKDVFRSVMSWCQVRNEATPGTKSSEKIATPSPWITCLAQ